MDSDHLKSLEKSKLNACNPYPIFGFSCQCVSPIYFSQIHKQRKEKISGYGRIDFYKDGSKDFVRGEGYFIDCGVEIKERRFLLSKINDSTVKGIIGKKHAQRNSDIKKLVRSIAISHVKEKNSM